MNARNGDGSTALGTAAFLGRAEMAKVLIDAGIDTSIRNDSRGSALANLDWGTTESIAAAFSSSFAGGGTLCPGTSIGSMGITHLVIRRRKPRTYCGKLRFAGLSEQGL